ncbi:MAG: hypothetical protein JNG41_05850 [Dialister sp.]|nr:hypothetical protein [Dialister sp.]
MRYIASSSDKVADKYDGRIRLNVKGQVNDATYVQGQFVNNMNFKNEASSNTTMAQIYVNHNFNKNVAVRLGRQPIAFGNQGGWLYNGLEGYDGAQASYNNGKLSLTTGFGQLNASDWGDEIGAGVVTSYGVTGTDMYFAKGAYDFGFAKLGADYVKFQGDTNSDDHYVAGQELYGINLTIPVQKFNVFGEYWKNTTTGDYEYDTAWNAGLSYGKADWKKAGTWDLSVAYNDVDAAVYFGGGTWHNDMLKNFSGGKYLEADNLTFWTAIANVTLQKNVQLHAEYAFGADAEGTDGGVDPDDSWTVSLNYKF